MKILAIMAAGLGSRYGSLKQLDTVSDEGYSIIDYSIYDAIESGFNHIIFIIREELLDDFVQRFDHLKSDTLQLSYIFQEVHDVPDAFQKIKRIKPWGTAHAMLSLRKQVDSSFALINADDFYGRTAFQAMHDALFNANAEDNYFLIAYKLKNTLSPNGSVSRGECFINDSGLLDHIIEREAISREGNIIRYKDANGRLVTLDDETLISMNFWGFQPAVFQHTDALFLEFLNQHANDLKSEFLIPSVVNTLIQAGNASVQVIHTDSVWYGITYKEDKQQVVRALASLTTAGVYPKTLWPAPPIQSLLRQFNIAQEFIGYEVLTSGHINDTFKIKMATGTNYILQKINTEVFTDTRALIANKVAISRHLKNTSRFEVSEYCITPSGAYCYRDSNDTTWTLSSFVENSETYLAPKNAEMARQAGLVIGDFHKSISGFDAGSLIEVLPGFHDITFRLQQFREALVIADPTLLNETKDLIAIVDSFEKELRVLHTLKSSGKFPLRVTHNDTKLSNILFDLHSKEAIALIDFDTVMPGIIHYDFGDAARSICSAAAEDEADPDKILFHLEYYRAFVQGFSTSLGSELSEIEVQYLPLSIKYMICSQGIRFLTDYLSGNEYYKIDYPKHNLVRAKNQLHLLQIVERQFQEIKSITQRVFEN